jgi:lipoyl(octanoyl) transferase
LDKQRVIFSDWGKIAYNQAWEKQEFLLAENVAIKTKARTMGDDINPKLLPTLNHLIFCEHPSVYTLGKSGNMSNVLLSEQELIDEGIDFYKTNRGGDITFHGPDQIVGYPILDLEKFKTDIGVYLRNIEEVIIKTIANFGIIGKRSDGETGVWIDNADGSEERKICAIGVRCSRWITMHGFALNVNTDLNYFNHIIPCGIQDKKVTSMQKELEQSLDIDEVKKQIKKNFEIVFEADLNHY